MPKVRRCRAMDCHNLVTTDHWYCELHRDQEAAYLASRAKWARSNGHEYRHKYNTVTRERNSVKSEQYRFYRSKRWQVLREQALERDHHLCRYCLVQGRYTPANTVDHIVPIEWRPSEQAEPDNLATICRSCHKAKTTWERKYYGTGQGNTIKNVDEIYNLEVIAKMMLEK